MNEIERMSRLLQCLRGEVPCQFRERRKRHAQATLVQGFDGLTGGPIRPEKYSDGAAK